MIRFLLGGLGGMRRRSSVLASYLLFEKAYCRELIRLGYSDTMERRDEMLQFLQRRDNSPPVLVAQPADAG